MKKLLTVLVITMLFCAAAYAADFVKVGDTVEFTREGNVIDYNYTAFDQNGGYIYTSPSCVSFFPWLFGSSANGVKSLEFIQPSSGIPKYLEYTTRSQYGDFALAVTDGSGVVMLTLPKDTCGIVKLPDSPNGWYVVQVGQKNAQYDVELQVVASANQPPKGLDYDLFARSEKGPKYLPVVGEVLKSDHNENSVDLCMPAVYTSFDNAKASGSCSTTFRMTSKIFDESQRVYNYGDFGIDCDKATKYLAYCWYMKKGDAQLVFTDGNDRVLFIAKQDKRGGYFKLPAAFDDGSGKRKIIKAKVVYTGTVEMYIAVGGIIASDMPPALPYPRDGFFPVDKTSQPLYPPENR